MLFNIKRMRTWWPLATLITTLTLAGCSDDDRKGIITPDSLNQVGSGEMFHGAEWATIKNLDPRGEQCVDCHGRSSDMSPNGKMAHNIGLQKNTDHSAYADLKIIGVKVNETSGEVTVTLNQALPANAGNLSMTFAKLAPRVIHNRGHDWQNYFNSNATGRGGNEPKASFMPNGGVQPVTVPSPQVNGKTITFNLGTGREFGTLADFTVKSAYEGDDLSWNYSGIKGTKIKMGDDLATHVYCDEAHANSNQTEDVAGAKSVCWWPDGTHLTAGTFVTTDNEFVVEYNPDQTHRVTIILGSSAGNPGFNTWYDFVPSVADGSKVPADFNAAGTTLTGSDYIEPTTGRVIALDYAVAEGNRAPGGTVNNDTQGHQSLPAARDVVDVQSCNSCHDGLTMHGGSGRSQTQTCVTCHNPGNLQASSGRSVDFKQLIHRLHRGTDLPSEASAIAELMNDDTSLVAETATDFTKVRFPQGPTPGSAAGITNCVKCHMGAETKDMVQGLADELGAPNFDVASKMKLAKVTAQGDNWLNVRTVNACQACHDSNMWFSSETGTSFSLGREGQATSVSGADKILPFYTEKYSDIGFNWLGKKFAGVATTGGGGAPRAEGWVHNVGTTDSNGRFTCGSSGGCHGVNNLNEVAVNQDYLTWGSRTGSHAVERMHLELTRNYIIAERFEIQILDAGVDEAGLYSQIGLWDRRDQRFVEAGDNIAGLGEITFNMQAMFGWMADGSPDYNHSTGKQNQPGAPTQNTRFVDVNHTPTTLNGTTTTANNDGTYTFKQPWLDANDEPNFLDRKSLADFDLKTSFGTAFVLGSIQIDGKTYNVRSMNQDFAFSGGLIDMENPARRQVVDFTAGQGIDENRDRYAGWDKEHGSNTQSCSSCHLQLSFHGGSRTNNTQLCIACHNPNMTDINNTGRRAELGADEQYEESEDFKRLIHAVHASADMRIDPVQHRANVRPSAEGAVRGHSFPGKLDNCKSCHIENNDGKWTFDLTQLPEGQIGSSAITGDWAQATAGTGYDLDGTRHNLDNHRKMTPIASVCSSCHDAGYKGGDDKVRTNANILDGGPYIGSHWWVMGGIAPGIVRPNELPSKTKHQSGEL